MNDYQCSLITLNPPNVIPDNNKRYATISFNPVYNVNIPRITSIETNIHALVFFVLAFVIVIVFLVVRGLLDDFFLVFH